MGQFLNQNRCHVYRSIENELAIPMAIRFLLVLFLKGVVSGLAMLQLRVIEELNYIVRA